MTITVDIVDEAGTGMVIAEVFDYFNHIDTVFSTFRPESEISRINRGEITRDSWSSEVTEVLALCEQTKEQTAGYFVYTKGSEFHPLGLVKGWAINNAADRLRMKGLTNFYIDAGGDVAVSGYNAKGTAWSVGIRDPFYREDIVKRLALTDCGIATSGTYIRGNHIYGPLTPDSVMTDVVSLTVIGPNIYEADRFATAAFAMGKKGVEFIETMSGLEAYQIDERGIATYTSGFERYVDHGNT